MDYAAETDTALEPQDTSADKLADVHDRAMQRFDECAMATQDNRSESLAARRFVIIPGAQWDGKFGVQFDNSIKLEVNKVGRGVEKIERDYRDNRIVPDFRPDGKDADPETADMLDGLHRADSYRFKSQQARDNACFEAIAGGFGAYRLTNEWEDQADKDNDNQRINPASLIIDADQSVFFDVGAKLYDKADARFAFVRTAFTRDAFEAEYDGEEANFPEGVTWKTTDWFSPDTVAVGEYYEKEEVNDTLWIVTNKLSGEEKRLWASDIEQGTLAELEKDGWAKSRQKRKRCRVHKYILSGADVIEDCGLIAGEMIPIIPVYGKRYFVDGVERWKGYVQDKMDIQRLYNSNISKLMEVNSLAPREVPIFAPEQMDPVMADEWARANIDRLPYLRAHPIRNDDGTIAAMGPIGKVEPPQLGPVTATLLQIANSDLQEDMQDADQVKANTSAEAMDIAATRVDAKSGIYLDNIRQSVQREGEVYLSMAKEVYVEEGRTVDTMTEEGDDGQAVLKQMVTDKTSGEAKVINDLQNGRYKVIVSVSEATATRRDKTVKAALNIAQVAVQAQDMELAQAAILTAVANTDGEGIDDLHDYTRQRGLTLGLFKPSEDEQKAMDDAQQNAKPDAMAGLADAQAEDFKAGAAKKAAETIKIAADTKLSEAKTIQTLADAHATVNAPQDGPHPEAANEDGPAIKPPRILSFRS